MTTLSCKCCDRVFKSTSGLLMHWNHNERCRIISETIAQSSERVQANNFGKSMIDSEAYLKNRYFEMPSNGNMCDNNLHEQFFEFSNDSSNREDDNDSVSNYNENTVHDLTIMMKHLTFKDNNEDQLSTPLADYKTYVDLLNILKTCNTPLYMFDKILKWACNAVWVHKFDFLSTNIIPRDKFVGSLKRQFDYSCLEPKNSKIELPGSETKQNLVLHDFKDCFYSLLSDSQLMDETNLLINPDDVFEMPPKMKDQKWISDINTGDVWRSAHTEYVNSGDSELLCPIIFFIDKTHTDLQGRLCIEQIRFTLGIFNLHIRHQSRAWRTLGYILDQNQIGTPKSKDKMQDYQAMTSHILKSLKDAQKMGICWNLVLKKKTVQVFFRVPILYIIGDTSGHDAIVGKFANRTSKVARLCRYCNCPYDKSDDPFYCQTEFFKLNKRKDIVKLIKDGNEDDLQQMAFHCVENAWSDLLFCDNKHGIYGATPVEIMHCLQKGLYEYVVQSLFIQKQEKKQKGKKRKKKNIHKENFKRNKELKEYNRKADLESDVECESDDDVDSGPNDDIEDDEDNDEDEDSNDDLEDEPLLDNVDIPGESIIQLSRLNVFSATYIKTFDQLTRKYGKHLMHQSNRDLPRTHFYTNYTSTGYKNASELSGMMIVYLMIFATNEGEDMIDKSFGAVRTGQWIHLFELLLLLETFCKAEKHKRRNVLLFRKMLPSIMNYYKETVKRKAGNQMKIIKYHLTLHFADDMLKFGSMANYDSSIGELHHKDFAKKPSKNTQRRKEIFEMQTAKIQINNLAIDRAFDYVYPGMRYSQKSKDFTTINKNKVIEFCGKINNIVKTTEGKKNRPICQWNDKVFLNQLVSESMKAIDNGNLKAPIQFFTQHNREGIIYRADPQFKKGKQPWYDWVKVDWGTRTTNAVPAKLLLFMEISQTDFIGTFKFGNSFIESPGSYALAYSLQENDSEQAHLDSMLVNYGKIERDDKKKPRLYAFNLDCIVETCIAVPYQTNETVINAHKWLFFTIKNKWYDVFIDWMKEKLKTPDA